MRSGVLRGLVFGFVVALFARPGEATPQWTRLPAPPAESLGGVIAYDAARGQVVLFGGSPSPVNPAINDTWVWDGSRWSQKSPATSPPVGGYPAMAYDSARNEVILFRGLVMDTWVWNGSTWTQRSTASPPQGARASKMAYDAARSEVVLFGGLSPFGVALADTWVWDGANWTQRFPAASPPARFDHDMAYDTARGEVVVFGGYSSSGPLADTWVWDGTNWTQRFPATSPPARSGHDMAYDAARGEVVLFGGVTGAQDTWTWDGSTWAQRFPSTTPPSAASMTYDAARGDIVLFGAGSSTGTWTWNGSNWRPALLVPPNNAAFLGKMVYDSARAEAVFFGTDLSITWAWNGSTWSERLPTALPPRRSEYAIAYDAGRNETVLFGGCISISSFLCQGALGDTWVWNGVTWTERLPATSPPARGFHTMTYDVARGEVVLWGGLGNCPGSCSIPVNDTWVWDGTNWTQRLTPNAPPGLSGASMTYDPARSEVVLFGGRCALVVCGQTWTWNGSDWSQRSAGAGPPGREGHVLAYDAAVGGAVLFGGLLRSSSGDGFPTDDTWTWNGTTWTEVVLDVRPRPQYGHVMAYHGASSRVILFGGDDTWFFGEPQALTAAASASPLSGPAPLLVSFSGSAAGGTPPYTLDWDFGDGFPHGTTQSPSHTYTVAGTYQAALTVGDAVGTRATAPSLLIQVLISSADLSVSQTASPDPAGLQRELKYTIVVSNDGPMEATDVTLADQLPDGVELVSTSQVACTGTRSIACSLGTLAAQATITLTIIVKPMTPGILRNVVTVTADQADPDSANNTSVLLVRAKASNVAFLPGLTGSRLYRTGLIEERIWEPSLNLLPSPAISFDWCRLRPRDDGTSEPGIYTRDIIDCQVLCDPFGLPTSPIGDDVYAAFAQFMDGLRTEQVLNDWRALPYDWRLDVERIARDGVALGGGVRELLVSSIEELVNTSATGRVTLVTHSNGGLLAKELLKVLEEEHKAEWIDRVIMVAAPQLGTPQAIAAMLHGDGQGFFYGLVASQAKGREAAETMIGAYNLLPSRGYFARGGGIPVIEFDCRPPLAPQLSYLCGVYPSGISEYGDDNIGFRGFLLGENGARSEPFTADCALAPLVLTSIPNVLRKGLLDRAETLHAFDSQALGVDVIQLAGWGPSTPLGVKYTSELNPLCAGAGCERVLHHDLLDTSNGDGTVVIPSAVALGPPASTFHFDLLRYNRDSGQDRQHHEIMGAWPVQLFIRRILEGALDPSIPQYIGVPQPTGARRLRVTVRSPVTLDAFDSTNRHTGPVPNPDPASGLLLFERKIPNSSFEPFGGDGYLTLDTDDNYRIELRGVDLGTFTLLLQEYVDDDLLSIVQYTDIPVSAVTRGELSLQHVADAIELRLDTDGDGVDDFILTPNAQTEPLGSLPILAAVIRTLGLPLGITKSLIAKVDAATTALQEGERDGAREALRALLHELRAQRGKNIPGDVSDKLGGMVRKYLTAIGGSEGDDGIEGADQDNAAGGVRREN
jgi:uncharacterized repeat protein (TIGR01451 family)